jgi:SAM-dependent methyltransferase
MGKGLRVKTTADGRAMLNLGCGPRTHSQWNNVDFSPYAGLARHKRLAKCLNVVGILSDFRYENLARIDRDIVKWDLRKGIPFPDEVLDAVYHSHFIGHLDRDVATYVTRECGRVLKPGGVLRVVVPDLGQLVALYNEAVERLQKADPRAESMHREALDGLFELMVRREPSGTRRQNFVTRVLERLARGGINHRGELLRWH